MCRPKIEIVTHCYAKRIPNFAKLLCFQLTSIMDSDYPELLLTLCHSVHDGETIKAAHKFLDPMKNKLRFIGLSEENMSRRCIGRNMAALQSDADIIWFADCDQVFLDDIFHKLADLHWPVDTTMIYPSGIMIHKDHETGDRLTSTITEYGPARIDVSEFTPKFYNRAIGGVQIIRGDFGRRFGYLKDAKRWQRPNKTILGDFHDDVAYRKYCAVLGKVTAVHLPGMYRIRHLSTSYQKRG